ncbi:MAG: GNAT family N-acetyltransferase [Polaribacter sp.]|jgi:GNAT superfamily N-acetyltransferase|uniref:GNAT family N-acetyltransferase n=1 Tax=uncultured Polaribacter sp. TaxID=174711 RepID=UPI00236FC3A1|nr:GNAT family N-acetyltransferase [Polaribacter sp.]|tara:strand:- start:54 stop:506 length:453 start_codon:yes stop_codon:yes gene_type:complete
MNIKTIRTNSKNKDFINLVKELDVYLKITDEDEHDFYNQFNSIDVLKEVVVTYVSENAVGCGAIKKFDNSTVEVKRMFVSLDNRGTGVAQKILQELETCAKELGYKKCILETGVRQVEAVKFYKKCGYKIIPNYGQYQGMENSICFEKKI